MPTRVIDVGPHFMACHLRGEGAPVLLLHSGGLSSRQWRRLGDMLADTHRVIIPDLLGYGNSSPWPDGVPFHFREDVAALATLLDELPPVHIVGHSYGGLLALQLALSRPAAVRSLSLFEPVAFGVLDIEADTDVRASMALAETYDGEPWLRAFVNWWSGPEAWDALAPEARASFQAVGWKLFQEVMSLMHDRTDSQTYGTISAPTLLLGGELTPLPERRVLARLHQTLPSATLQLFADVGHMGPITHASRVNAAIVEHIKTHTPESTAA